jgi:mRNA interferase RelE/StbE
MKVEFKKSFLKDLKTIKNSNLKKSIASCIIEIENSKDLSSIRNLKKLSGYNNYYRIRINDYRLGLKVEEDVVYFVIIEHRKDIYKVFP